MSGFIDFVFKYGFYFLTLLTLFDYYKARKNGTTEKFWANLGKMFLVMTIIIFILFKISRYYGIN